MIGLHHTGLTVPDLDTAVAFYTAVGGFEDCLRFSLDDTPAHRQAMATPSASANVAWLKGPTGYLELMQFENPTNTGTVQVEIHDSGIRHICLQEVDANPFYDDFIAAGGSGHARPVGLGTGNLYAYVQDPFGNWLELEGLPYAPDTTAKPWYAHTAFVTHNFDQLLEFYEKLLATKRSSDGTFGPAEPFDIVSGLDGTHLRGGWVPVTNGAVEIWQYLAPERAPKTPALVSDPGFSHVCFEVEDIAAETARLTDLGVRFLSDPINNGTVTTIYGRDPDDNLFELLAFADPDHRFSLRALDGNNFLSALKTATADHYKKQAAAAKA